ncbi:hypothetical protein [Demequina sp. NBRC 110054]|uniref:hypothetical protein n=1 Tax=Demequina sp. NBRC 110054 TaxID=1570343 RepID=UPI0011780D2B|nr:hypothetical protein [Demequina sp. NBRC 110054]
MSIRNHGETPGRHGHRSPADRADRRATLAGLAFDLDSSFRRGSRLTRLSPEHSPGREGLPVSPSRA